jgi:NAD(P)-dependent dehydrogenase (short-subunit alcohol dehydrogenase family)
MPLKGLKILITGGAGGLGSDMVRESVKSGADVTFLDRQDEPANQLLKEVAAGPGRAEYVRADLADLDTLQGRLQTLAESCDGFDVLVNNAAIYPRKTFTEFTVHELESVLRVNTSAAFLCAQTLLPWMKRNHYGRIINIASITFYGGWARLAPYVTSKGGLVGLTRALARELGEFGITVNAISPGAFPTDAEKIHPDPEGYNRMVLDSQSIKRRGHAGDIANAVAFFASPDSGFITGQMLNVDGGWNMQ